MDTIKVEIPANDSLKAQLKALYCTFSKIKNNEPYNFDLSGLKWIYPLLILPVAAYSADTRSSSIPPNNEDSRSYLDTIKFPVGVTSVSEFQKMKRYIPISFLSRKTDPVSRAKLESCFGDLIYKTIGSSMPGVQSAILFPISELLENIFQHSKRDEGWLLAQIYPKKKFLDLCIIDRGRGLKTAYEEAMNLKLSDTQAIEKAMEGVSIKADKERGYGLRTSKRVVCEAMGGSFMILSGNAVLFAENQEQKILTMGKVNWQGVIIAYRIPFPKNSIHISQYLE